MGLLLVFVLALASQSYARTVMSDAVDGSFLTITNMATTNRDFCFDGTAITCASSWQPTDMWQIALTIPSQTQLISIVAVDFAIEPTTMIKFSSNNFPPFDFDVSGRDRRACESYFTYQFLEQDRDTAYCLLVPKFTETVNATSFGGPGQGSACLPDFPDNAAPTTDLNVAVFSLRGNDTMVPNSQIIGNIVASSSNESYSFSNLCIGCGCPLQVAEPCMPTFVAGCVTSTQETTTTIQTTTPTTVSTTDPTTSTTEATTSTTEATTSTTEATTSTTEATTSTTEATTSTTEATTSTTEPTTSTTEATTSTIEPTTSTTVITTTQDPNACVTVEVELRNIFFSPEALSVRNGDTVRFRWIEGFHNVENTVSPGSCQSANPPLFRSGGITGVVNTTFDVLMNFPEGVHPYKCTPHCGNGMVGTLTVAGACAGGTTATTLATTTESVATTTTEAPIETTTTSTLATTDATTSAPVATTTAFVPPVQGPCPALSCDSRTIVVENNELVITDLDQNSPSSLVTIKGSLYGAAFQTFDWPAGASCSWDSNSFLCSIALWQPRQAFQFGYSVSVSGGSLSVLIGACPSKTVQL